MKKFLNDFKAFALKGNIVDMAVGVVIGGAFGKIVTSLVQDIITPVISVLTGKVSLVDLKYVLSAAELSEAGEILKNEVAINYGSFVQSIIDFLIIALSIFVVIRIMMKAQESLAALKKKEEEIKEEAPAKKPDDIVLLEEIRDLLKK